MNVLLIDDDPIFNLVHKKLLEKTGRVAEINKALNGEEAIALFNDFFTGSRSLPDLILLDLNMPIMDGFSFLEALKKMPSAKGQKTKIAIVTSSNDPRDVSRAKEYGIEFFLTKPISENSLTSLLA